MAGLLIAFKKINYSLGIFKSPWVGLSNFKYLFSNSDALIALRNTILYNLGFILFGNLLAIVVAIALDSAKNKYFKQVSQVVYLIPFLLSTVIVSYIAFAFLSPTNGFMNNTILPMFGIDDPIKWYNEAKYWPVILNIVYLWMSFGYSSILYYSAVISIDKTYYEAAVVDGANKWQKMRSIDIPLLMPTAVVLFILRAGSVMSVGFEKVYLLQNDLNISASEIISTYVYKMGLKSNQYSYSAAIGLFNNVVNFILLLSVNFIAGKMGDTSLF